MKLTTLCTLSICLLVILKTAQAQVSKEQGFIVFNNGDTLQGWIQSQTWKTNPRKIKFFPQERSTARTVYRVKDLKYFEIAGKEAYERANVMIELKTAACVDPGDLELYMDTVFLRYIIKGKRLSLYELCNEGETVYYLRLHDRDSTMYRQLFHSYAWADPEIFPNYQQQLAEVADALHLPGLIPGIKSAPYKVEDLANIFTVLNSGSANIYFKPERYRIKPWKWMIGAQVGFPKVRLRNDFNSVIASSFFAGSELGITAAMQSNRNALRFRGQMDIRLGEYQSKTERGFWAPRYFLEYWNIIPSIHAVYPISERTGMSFYASIGLVYSMIRYENRYFDGFKWAAGEKDSNELTATLSVAAHIRSRLELKISYLYRDHGIYDHPKSSYWKYDLPVGSLAVSYIW